MPISFRMFAPQTSLRPRLACEVMPEGVVAAQQRSGSGKEGEAVMAFAPLSAGAVTPGLGVAANVAANQESNFTNQPAVVAALRQALNDVSAREKQLTLVIPDAAVRVLLMDFDTLPTKQQEALPIVRFRLKKLAPFEVDDAAVSYQVMREKKEAGQTQLRVLATVMPAAVRAEYEGAVRAAGYEPGVLMPSTLASLASLPADGAALVINHNGPSLTTAITQGGELLLHRTLELPTGDELNHDELASAVSVAVAYFEDTLKQKPRVLNYVGPGGAQEFTRVLGPALLDALTTYGLQIRDLVSGPPAGALTAMPPGLSAGVMGALAN